MPRHPSSFARVRNPCARVRNASLCARQERSMTRVSDTAVTVFALDWRSGLLVLAAGVPMYFLARWYQKHSQILLVTLSQL